MRLFHQQNHLLLLFLPSVIAVDAELCLSSPQGDLSSHATADYHRRESVRGGRRCATKSRLVVTDKPQSYECCSLVTVRLAGLTMNM